MASTQNLQVIIDATNNTAGAFKGVRGQIAKTQQKFRQVGRKMQTIGTRMTQAVTAPILGAAGAAVKFSSDFEDQAAKVRSTADLTKEEIDAISQSVEGLADKTGQASDGIFQAFQKAMSGSLNLAESKELVAEATEASAAGFGEEENLVNVATTGYDLFTDSAKSAKEILNQIVNAAQNTQVEVRNMASAFGRGSSVAAELGLNQNEFASILGVVSERFGDTQRGGRAVASMFRTLLKPSKEAAGNLQKTFGSVKNFREELSKNAIGALRKLKERLNDNNKGLQNVIRSGNALNAAQVLLSDNGERVNKILDKQADSAGAVNEALEKSASFSRELMKTWRNLKSAARAVGDAIIDNFGGILNSIQNSLQSFEKWFESLGDNMQNLIITSGLVAAAIGPLLAIMGTFSILIGSISATAVVVTGAIAGLAAAGAWMATNWGKVKGVVKSVWQQLKEWGVIKLVRQNINLLVRNFRQNFLPVLREFWQRHGQNFKDIAKAIAVLLGGTLFVAIQGIITLLNGLVSLVGGVVKAWIELTKFNKETLIPALINLGNWIRNTVVSAVNTMISSIKTAVEWFGDLIEKIENFLSLEDKLPDWAVEGVGGALPDFFDVSGSFDSGGVVPGPVGKPRLAKVHGGETVLPTHKQGFAAGGGNVNITINGDVSGREVIEKVKQGLMSELERETKISLQ